MAVIRIQKWGRLTGGGATKISGVPSIDLCLFQTVEVKVTITILAKVVPPPIPKSPSCVVLGRPPQPFSEHTKARPQRLCVESNMPSEARRKNQNNFTPVVWFCSRTDTHNTGVQMRREQRTNITRRNGIVPLGNQVRS